jgi:hypothetical protein
MMVFVTMMIITLIITVTYYDCGGDGGYYNDDSLRIKILVTIVMITIYLQWHGFDDKNDSDYNADGD